MEEKVPELERTIKMVEMLQEKKVRSIYLALEPAPLSPSALHSLSSFAALSESAPIEETGHRGRRKPE